MGTCKYCGQKAGLFSSAHKECEEKHSTGIDRVKALLDKSFHNELVSCSLNGEIKIFRQDNFLSDEDIASILNNLISQYASRLKRPYSASSMKFVDALLNACDVPYQTVASLGSLNEFTKMLMRSFMIDYFTDKLPLSTAQSRCESVLRRFPMPQSEINDAYWHVLDKASSKFLDDGFLTDDEQRKIEDYTRLLNLPMNNVPAKYQNGEISKISQSVLIKAIQQGIMPKSNFTAPIMLSRGETVLWVYNDVTTYQEKIIKEWVGRNNGLSFRVCKGVYYRTGRTKGRPVEHSSMELQGIGSLYVTNKNLIFWSPQKNIKVSFAKIIGFTPYSDGIEIHRDGATAKRLVFQGLDPWFIMNLSSIINN